MILGLGALGWRNTEWPIDQNNGEWDDKPLDAKMQEV